jgi:hypothetical protein
MTRSALASEFLAPEVVLPAQYFTAAPRTQRQPELRLMLAVLEDAVLTLVRHAGDNRPAARRLVREVERWVEARASDWPFSFENVCAVLGFDAAAVRRRLRRLQTEPLGAGEPGRVLFVGRRVAGRRHRVSVRRRHCGTSRADAAAEGRARPRRRFAGVPRATLAG